MRLLMVCIVTVAGYAGDVWPQQPAPPDHPWRTAPNNGEFEKAPIYLSRFSTYLSDLCTGCHVRFMPHPRNMAPGDGTCPSAMVHLLESFVQSSAPHDAFECSS